MSIQSAELLTPKYDLVVPNQLTPLVTDHVREVHARWQHKTFRDIKKEAAEVPLDLIDVSDEYGVDYERKIGVFTLDPEGDRDESLDGVLILPYQQHFKESMYNRAKVFQEVVFPNHRLYVVAKNSVGHGYFSFTKEEKEQLANGDSAPLEQMILAGLKVRGVGNVAVSGFSEGGINAVGLAAVNHGDINITHVNADEAPSKHDRTAKQVQKDFTKSGGPIKQLLAIHDSATPAASRALSVPRLAKDYAAFGVTSLSETSKLLLKAMAGSIEDDVRTIVSSHPETVIKLGYVAGSRMFDPESVAPHLARQVEYTGRAARAHATGDNIFAHALMALDGFTGSRSQN